MDRRTLQIVEMNLPDDARAKIDRNLGPILAGWSLQRSDRARRGMNPIGRTEQPIQIIERMDERQHDSATEIGSGAVAIAMIFPRMPIGQILAPLGSRPHDPPQFAGCQSFAQANEQRMKSILATDHRHKLFFSNDFGQFLATIERIRQRLFDKQIAAIPSRGQCDFNMRGTRIRDHGDPRPMRPRGIELAHLKPCRFTIRPRIVVRHRAATSSKNISCE